MGKLLKEKTSQFFKLPIFQNDKLLAALWLLTAFVGGILKFSRGSHNNYDIFRHVFDHAQQGQPLYIPYPDQYGDVNLYGIFFSFVIAPFAALPVMWGGVLWVVANSALLYWAIRSLPLDRAKIAAIVWLCINELYTAVIKQQFNIAIAAIVLLAFVLVERRKEFWAAFFIMLGTFTKIYGIVGLAFFFFSKNKSKFILSLLFWAAVMFLLPMVFFGGEYVIQQYQQWFEVLAHKGGLNVSSLHQNISLLGMARKISGDTSYSDLWLILPGMLLFALPYLRVHQYRHLNFRLMLLSSVLLFMVLFSTGSESSGYIIAMLGVSLWFLVTPSTTRVLNTSLLIFALLLTSLSSTDLFPRSFHQTYIFPYALKALPCVLIWFKVSYELLFLSFSPRKKSALEYVPVTYADVDVVLPCYNPVDNWVETLAEGYRCLSQSFPDKRFRFIISDDGSVRNVDQTHVDRLCVLLPNSLLIHAPANAGKGAAVRRGVAAATADCILYTDIDLPYQLDSMSDVIHALERGSDIVTSSRNHTYYSELSFRRKLFSRVSKMLNRVLLGLEHNDTQGGLKGFNRRGKPFLLDTHTDRFLFDTEFITLASRHDDIRIDEVVVNLRSGVILPNVKQKVLMQEMINFIRIILRS